MRLIKEKMQPSKEWPYRYSKELMDKAKESWQKRAGKVLTYEEVEEGLSNLVGFFEILIEADKKQP